MNLPHSLSLSIIYSCVVLYVVEIFIVVLRLYVDKCMGAEYTRSPSLVILLGAGGAESMAENPFLRENKLFSNKSQVLVVSKSDRTTSPILISMDAFTLVW